MRDYLNDYELIARMEEKVRERGLEVEYLWHLIAIHKGAQSYQAEFGDLVNLFFSTREQRCRAAVLAAEQSKPAEVTRLESD